MLFVGNKADLIETLRGLAAKERQKIVTIKTDGRRTDANMKRERQRETALAAAVAYEYAAELAQALRSFDGPSSEELTAKLRAQHAEALTHLGGK